MRISDWSSDVCSSDLSPLPTRSFTRGRRRASISLTPLIDVVFILLIFFMLASSFLDERAIEIDSPAPALGGPSLDGALFVELRGDGLRPAGDPLTTPPLLARPSQHAARTPRRRGVVTHFRGHLNEPVVGLRRV